MESYHKVSFLQKTFYSTFMEMQDISLNAIYSSTKQNFSDAEKALIAKAYDYAEQALSLIHI